MLYVASLSMVVMLCSISVLPTCCNMSPVIANNYAEHFKRVREFRCGLPQKRAIPLSELIKTQMTDEVFFPPVTVLHRCDTGSGCCMQGDRFTCAPVEQEEVKLMFLVKHSLDRSRSQHHEIITAMNHTKCGCLSDT